MREVAIIGAGIIKFGKTPEYAPAKMGGDAARMALEQAGIEPNRIEATFCGNIGNAPNLAQRVNGEVGLTGVAVAATVRCDGGPCRGTNKADTITGSSQRDRMSGLGGHDRMGGGRGSDRIYGGDGADTMSGGYGNDFLSGGPDGETMSGGPFSDRMFGGTGVDSIFGNSGNDTIFAEDGQADSISCGAGEDTAFIDGADLGVPLDEFISVTSCEDVQGP